MLNAAGPTERASRSEDHLPQTKSTEGVGEAGLVNALSLPTLPYAESGLAARFRREAPAGRPAPLSGGDGRAPLLRPRTCSDPAAFSFHTGALGGRRDRSAPGATTICAGFDGVCAHAFRFCMFRIPGGTALSRTVLAASVSGLLHQTSCDGCGNGKHGIKSKACNFIIRSADGCSCR